MAKNKNFEFLEHEADIKIKVNGKSLNEIFEISSLAFSDYISSGKKIKQKAKKEISISASDSESLLYKFIDELIFLLDAEDFAVSSAKVKVKDFSLSGVLSGDSVKNSTLKHVKSATYAEMYIKNINNGWEAQFVIDV